MDFALFHLPTYRAGFATGQQQFFEELSASVRLADALGWARTVVSEHHFHYYGGPVPNPAVILAAWARETQRIRLGTAVSLVPLRHPLQVAEDYAMVDQLSGGRFEFEVSRGFVPHEYEAFGVTHEETVDRILEGMSVIERFWRGEPFAHEGKFYRFGTIAPWPVPQQRQIPVWMAASNERSSFERIGQLGCRLLMNQYPMSFEALVERHGWYRNAWDAAGHAPGQRRSGVSFMTYLADTEDEAIAVAKGPLQEHVNAYRTVQQHNEFSTAYAGDESLLLALCEGGDIRDVFRRRTLVCTPAQAVERLLRYRALGFDELIFICRFGAITHEQCCRTIERLTHEVRPKLV